MHNYSIIVIWVQWISFRQFNHRGVIERTMKLRNFTPTSVKTTLDLITHNIIRFLNIFAVVFSIQIYFFNPETPVSLTK